MDAVLQQTLVDAVSMLQSRAIPFAVIGGLAVSFCGQPRMTGVVDLVFQPEIDAARRRFSAVAAAGLEPATRLHIECSPEGQSEESPTVMHVPIVRGSRPPSPQGGPSEKWFPAHE